MNIHDLSEIFASCLVPLGKPGGKETMNSSVTENLISLPQAAARLDISVRALYRLMARNELPKPVKVGGSSKLFRSDLDGYLDRLKSTRQR